ncbi:hypothetical protein KSF_036140 [Reticulibacter mediterranei]|uniref:3-keto-disaccharide hydrolase domain-containing protein n=1 Tax=Reticulibacter mediterranei TaxID=2778369 RepID=A0A8J3IFJ2_9CHLR|nr:hypothetical protein [Reticulibacter mediterranei]GHO93566.1 hypothetical protein KSF_036140 [Reticulibacter mediterranei]
MSASSSTPPLQAASTGYGVDPYHVPPPLYDPYKAQTGTPPYGSTTEYAPPPPPSYSTPVTPPPFGDTQPPLPSQRNQKKRTLVIVGIVVLALILVGEGFVLFSSSRPAPPKPQATATPAGVTPTAQQNQNPYGALGGTLVASDPMRDNSKGYKWDEATMNDDKNHSQQVCTFKDGAYHLTSSAKGGLICDPEAPALTISNLVFEANLTINKGNETGLTIRVDQTKATNYLFYIDTQGNYGIGIENPNAANQNDQYKSLNQGKNAAIKIGLNQSNLLAIAANGDTMSVYVNGQFVASVQDKTYSSGQIGIYAYGDTGCDIAVSNVRVWKL